jgi:signal transduction histidine kinase
MKSGRLTVVQQQWHTLWQGMCHWLQCNSRAPGWLPARWRHPLVGYLLVVPLMVLAIALDLAILHIFPKFEFDDLPVTVAILLIALAWGAGPALFATLLGTFLLYYVAFPPHFAILWKDVVDIVQNAGVIIGGLIITLAVSHRDTQLRLAQQRAQQEAEMRRKMDAFLVITSHELKTPLTTIRLHLQLTQRRLEHALEKAESSATSLKHLLKTLREQVASTLEQWSRLNLLVNDLLEMSRIQADKLEFALHTMNLIPLIETLVDDERQAAPERTIHLMLPPDAQVLVDADPYQLEQVLRNYLANALKYSPETALVTVGVTLEAGQVRVWVRDQGPGLPMGEQHRIWERFYRAPGIEVQSGSGVGLGIGLYLCRAIIAEHRGQVGVESVPGQGSTFWFVLPLVAPS